MNKKIHFSDGSSRPIEKRPLSDLVKELAQQGKRITGRVRVRK